MGERFGALPTRRLICSRRGEHRPGAVEHDEHLRITAHRPVPLVPKRRSRRRDAEQHEQAGKRSGTAEPRKPRGIGKAEGATCPALGAEPKQRECDRQDAGEGRQGGKRLTERQPDQYPLPVA
jgi:hypothetical protein